jgi:hypothetical protein
MTNEFDIIEHPLVILWLKEFAKNEPLGLIFLTGGNVSLFKNKWGNPSGATQNLQYWKREHSGINIYVYADENITFFKVQYLGDKEKFLQDKKIGTYITGFLSKLTKEFLNI